MTTAAEVIALKGERASDTAIQAWHNTRISKIDELYRGDVSVVFNDETTRRNELQIANVVQLGMDDMARLVSESIATIRCAPKKNTETEKRAAKLRESIALTYWDSGAGALLEPRLGMDLFGSGAAFLLCWADKKVSDYPKPLRLNPRNCFPDLGQLGQNFAIGTDPGIIDSELHDLIVVTKMPLRTANRVFKLQLGTSKDQNREIEIVDYYSPDELVKVLDGLGPPVEIARSSNPLGRVPVAFGQLDSFDGQFRGVFDQTGPVMKTLNRLYTLLLDDAARRIYSQPIFTPDIDPRTYGQPGQPIIAESTEAAAAVRLLAPESASPSLFPLLQQLEHFIHLGSGYPEQRGGEVSQSIASATFVSATMGVLTTIVKNGTRIMANMREQWNSMAFAFDEKTLNFDKPLSRPFGNTYTYLPGKDLNGAWTNRVVYSPGMGITEANELVGNLQALGARVISRETVQENIREVRDHVSEQQKIDYEDAQDTFKQKLLQNLDVATHAKVLRMMAEGKTLAEVAAELEANPPPAPAAAAEPAQPEATAPPEQVSTEQTALQKGAIPGGEDNKVQAPEFAPGAPLSQILVR